MKRLCLVLAHCTLVLLPAIVMGASFDDSKLNVIDGVVSVNDSADAEYSIASDGTFDESLGSGILVTDDNIGTNGLYLSDSGSFQFGDDDLFYTVKKDDDGIPYASLTGHFPLKDTLYSNVILLDDASHESESEYADGATELSIGVGIYATGSDTFTNINNSYIWTSGAIRSAIAVEDLATIVVENSYIESTGGITTHKPVTRLLLSTCRANVAVGGTAYYYNSKVVTRDWGALSTDTGGPNATYLYAYNMDTLNTGGGYSTYADTNCFVEIYGSRMKSAEMGGFVAGDGVLTIGSSNDASDEALEYMDDTKLKRDTPSIITGRRNAIIMHLVDSMGTGSGGTTISGTLNVSNSTLSTICDIDSARDYSTDTNSDSCYGESALYINHHKGSVIALRSTNADINLTHVTMEAAPNVDTGEKVLIHSVLNYDARGAVYADDGDEFLGLNINLDDMDLTGDILHEDYQRQMTLTFEDTRLTGKIVSGTMANWNALWSNLDSEYADEIYDLLTQDETYNTIWGIRMSMDNNSKWIVTGNSSLYSLTIADHAEIKAPAGYCLSIYTDCTMSNDDLFYDYTTGTPVKALEPGETYTGVVLVVEKNAEKPFVRNDHMNNKGKFF